MTKILMIGYVTMVQRYERIESGGFSHTFANAIHKGLVHQIGKAETVTELALSSLCDPRYKKVGFRDPENASKAVSNLRAEILKYKAGRAEEGSVPTPPKQCRTDNPLWDILDREVQQAASSSGPVGDTIALEVGKYLRQ